MVYTDRVHMIASSIEELHEFAAKIGLHKCYYRNPRKKRHPHYDLMNEKIREKAIEHGAIVVTDREIVKLCRKFYGERIL
jgi:hypothetical protein